MVKLTGLLSTYHDLPLLKGRLDNLLTQDVDLEVVAIMKVDSKEIGVIDKWNRQHPEYISHIIGTYIRLMFGTIQSCKEFIIHVGGFDIKVCSLTMNYKHPDDCKVTCAATARIVARSLTVGAKFAILFTQYKGITRNERERCYENKDYHYQSGI